MICNSPQRMEVVFAWYWVNERGRVTWDYQLPPGGQSARKIWGFYYGPEADASCQRLADEMRRQDAGWRLGKRIRYVYRVRGYPTPQRCELFCFERAQPGPE